MGFRDTVMTNCIGNYALMYAINRYTDAVQRNASGTVPFYKDDMPKMSIYSSPAFMATEFSIPIQSKMIRWENQPQIYLTFNSVNTMTQLTETARANLPQIGRKAKYPPLNSFEFFTIGGNPQGIVRLGKKQVPCRIYTYQLSIERSSSDIFQSSHPINLDDLEGWSPGDIKNAELIRQTPPLLVNARLKAKHYICTDGKRRYYIARPDPDKYRSVPLP
jgi:CRISPR type I-D-associated protein Csc1